MGSDNDDMIEAAAEAIRLRSQDDPPGLSIPPNWRDKGIDLIYAAQVIVRLRPADDDATRVEVLRREDELADEVVRRYHSADGLADLIEGVHQRALSR